MSPQKQCRRFTYCEISLEGWRSIASPSRLGIVHCGARWRHQATVVGHASWAHGVQLPFSALCTTECCSFCCYFLAVVLHIVLEMQAAGELKTNIEEMMHRMQNAD